MAGTQRVALTLGNRIKQSIGLGESHFREFKSAYEQRPEGSIRRDAKSIAKDVGEALVAFANADGGELIVGIEDDGTITGVPHIREFLDIILNAPYTHVHNDTPLSDVRVSKMRIANMPESKILHFSVQKSTEYIHLTSDGRCMQRRDRNTIPVSVERIQYKRQERAAMEYDREPISEAGVGDIDIVTVGELADLIMPGASPELFLQYLDLAEYTVRGLRLKKAALLLFAKDVSKWHPRVQVRIIRVAGSRIGSGEEYEVAKDEIIRGSIMKLMMEAWDILRPYLAVTTLGENSVFVETLLYPETACREALTNAIAHRDYSIEGRGIEIYVFDNRIEVVSPGGLLPTVQLAALKALKRVHQSRNPYVTRTLREAGYMRELGEGIPRIFSAMAARDLAAPELIEERNEFKVILHSKSIFSDVDQSWLDNYLEFALSIEDKKVMLLCKGSKAVSANEIIDVLNIVDTEDYRKLMESMLCKGLLYQALTKSQVTSQGRKLGSKRDVPRFKVRGASELKQFLQELESGITGEKDTVKVNADYIMRLKKGLSESSPYIHDTAKSLFDLGYIGSDKKPLPKMTGLWTG